MIFKKKIAMLFFLPVLTFPAFATLKLLRSVVQDSQSMFTGQWAPSKGSDVFSKELLLCPASDGAAPRS